DHPIPIRHVLKGVEGHDKVKGVSSERQTLGAGADQQRRYALGLQALPADDEPSHGDVDPRRAAKDAASRQEEPSWAAAQVEDPGGGGLRNKMSEPAGVVHVLPMLQSRALNLCDPHVGALLRYELLAHSGPPETLEEIPERRARVSFSKRRGERPVLFVV